ncbi:MAG: hypothetical protein AB7N76_36310 [Planctomycetota bacterium]
MRKGATQKGVFCLEGEWTRDLRDGTTVEHLLRLLASAEHLPYVYRRVGTQADLRYYLRRWASYTSFGVLYLGFHGRRGGLRVPSDGEEDALFSLDELAEVLGDSCAGRVVHFGSCETLRRADGALDAFLERTGLLAISGFQRPVVWSLNAAFELLLLARMQDYELSRRGLRALERRLRRDAEGLAAHWTLRVRAGSA